MVWQSDSEHGREVVRPDRRDSWLGAHDDCSDQKGRSKQSPLKNTELRRNCGTRAPQPLAADRNQDELFMRTSKLPLATMDPRSNW